MIKLLGPAILVLSGFTGGCSSDSGQPGPASGGSAGVGAAAGGVQSTGGGGGVGGTTVEAGGTMSTASGGGNCPPVTVYGVAATVTDASTGSPICDATVTLTDTSDPTHVETAMPRGTGMDCTYVGAKERPGTYKVEASKSGYKSASTEVTVTQFGTTCKHVLGQNPMLALERS